MVKEVFLIEIENEVPFSTEELYQVRHFISSRMQGYSMDPPKCLTGEMSIKYEPISKRRNDKIEDLGV